MYIICGLGNPGRKYENTRHNAGFRTLDLMAEEAGAGKIRRRFRGEVRECTVGDEQVILFKPLTYMNKSGIAVSGIMRFHKSAPERLIVIFDDFDVPLGQIRVRKFGSAGTHNGMRSVIQELGTDRFPRIRIGTGREGKGDLNSFVTGPVSEEERKILAAAEVRAKEAALAIIEHGIERAMNVYNRKSE